MIQYKDVIGSERPEPKIISPTIVDINYNIEQIVQIDEMSGTKSKVWIWDTYRYTVEEYLTLQDTQKEQTITDLQLALVDIYEGGL